MIEPGRERRPAQAPAEAQESDSGSSTSAEGTSKIPASTFLSEKHRRAIEAGCAKVFAWLESRYDEEAA